MTDHDADSIVERALQDRIRRHLNEKSPGPRELCQQYANGHLTRADLIDQLTRYPYVETPTTDGYDSLIVDPPGTWSEVSAAVRSGLIADDVYEEIYTRRHKLN